MEKSDFNKLDENEKKKVLERVKDFAEFFSILSPDGNRINYSVVSFSGNRLEVRGEEILRTPCSVVVNFLLNDYQYFMKTHLEKDEGKFFIECKGPLFKLQRRSNFRVKIKENEKTIFHGPCEVSFSVKNLSLGGGLFWIENPCQSYKAKDCFSGILSLFDLGDLPVNLQVKHVKQTIEGGLFVGVEFRSLSSDGRALLNQYIMSSYRKDFLRYS